MYRLSREAYPDWKEAFHIEADASGTGVGAVLGQMDKITNKVRPIEYFSSALSSSQRNYSAGQLETWAAIAATRKWSVYLKGAERVVVHTDHSPLKWLQAQKDPKPTFARWLMELQGLPLEIEVRPGKENCVADYLSRNQTASFDEEVNSEDTFEDKIYLAEEVQDLPDRIAKGQLDDEIITNALAQMRAQGEVINGPLKRVREHLRDVGDQLYFQNRVVVPKQMRSEVIRRVHSQHHFGKAGTLQSVRKNFFWIKMAGDVGEFCRTCLTCNRSKPSNKGKEPIREMCGNEGIPGYAVGIDIGTLPWSEDDYRYFLLIVDLFSRHIEIAPLRDQRATTLVEAFEHSWIYRGHGVPKVILSDQGSNVDGETFRSFCRALGVNKRRTTPYRPQSDGMSERNIGMVKQVIRCLQQDRHLDRGSWPSLLAEVSFHCNSMVNNTTRISPHMLTYGREPLSPLDAWCNELQEDEMNSHNEYLESLRRKQTELNEIAKYNSFNSLEKARRRLNEGKSESKAAIGDLVFLKRQAREDSLVPRFDGPYKVLDRNGSDVKLRLPRRDKWVHLDHCKLFEGTTTTVHPPSATTEETEPGAVPNAQPEQLGPMVSQEDTPNGLETSSSSAAAEYEQPNSLEDIEETEFVPERRYPRRETRPPQYLADYTEWDGMPRQ